MYTLTISCACTNLRYSKTSKYLLIFNLFLLCEILQNLSDHFILEILQDTYEARFTKTSNLFKIPKILVIAQDSIGYMACIATT